jgi:hypothetical protein
MWSTSNAVTGVIFEMLFIRKKKSTEGSIYVVGEKYCEHFSIVYNTRIRAKILTMK